TEHAGAELGGDLGQGGLAGLHDLAGQHVGVDDDGPQLAKDRVDRALAGRDAPGQPDEQEGAGRGHTSDQSLPDLTSTTTGTRRGSAAAMISRARASTAGTSSGGASKSSSSWTCSSVRARSPRPASGSVARTMAILSVPLP